MGTTEQPHPHFPPYLAFYIFCRGPTWGVSHPNPPGTGWSHIPTQPDTDHSLSHAPQTDTTFTVKMPFRLPSLEAQLGAPGRKRNPAPTIHEPRVLLLQLLHDVHHHGQEGLVSCVALGRDRDSCHPTMAEETQHHHIYLPGEWWAKPRSAAETSVPTAGTQGTWVISWETC